MRNSESVKEPAPVPEHGQSSGVTAPQIESERSTKTFHVVKAKSRRPSLGRFRVDQRRTGRWNPPPRLFKI